MALVLGKTATLSITHEAHSDPNRFVVGIWRASEPV